MIADRDVHTYRRPVNLNSGQGFTPPPHLWHGVQLATCAYNPSPVHPCNLTLLSPIKRQKLLFLCKSSNIQITQPVNLPSRSVTIEDQISLIAFLKLLPSGMAYRLQITTAVAVLIVLLLPLRALALATSMPTLETECDTKARHCGWELMEKQGM